MGGDLLVAALVGEERDAEGGDELRQAHGEQFDRLVEEVEPLEGAQGTYLDRYLGLLDARDLIDAATTSDDVETSKPAPDLVEAAKGNARMGAVGMVGDSPWDVVASARADLPCVALLTGGYSERELLDAGAEMVFESLVELGDRLGETSLDRGSRR
jgi:phosphoglycolate phosphatase-like HAD superfamily hydrolase